MAICVLLSIKPTFADRIFYGDKPKRFEFRRRLFANREVKKIVVYVTAPVSKVIGEFDIDDIIALEPECLWEETQEYSGISKEFFDAYFEGRPTGFAIKIGKTHIYKEPLELKADFNVKAAPQSFVYVDR
jgi:predicted transcriptional regulator